MHIKGKQGQTVKYAYKNMLIKRDDAYKNNMLTKTGDAYKKTGGLPIPCPTPPVIGLIRQVQLLKQLVLINNCVKNKKKLYLQMHVYEGP